MAFPIKTCVSCGEEFELKPDKPGFANRCPTCSEPEPAELASVSKQPVDYAERKAESESTLLVAALSATCSTAKTARICFSRSRYSGGSGTLRISMLTIPIRLAPSLVLAIAGLAIWILSRCAARSGSRRQRNRCVHPGTCIPSRLQMQSMRARRFPPCRTTSWPSTTTLTPGTPSSIPRGTPRMRPPQTHSPTSKTPRSARPMSFSALAARQAAACVAQILMQQAQADAMTGSMSSNQAYYVQNWAIGALAIAWLKVRPAGPAALGITDPPGRRPRIVDEKSRRPGRRLLRRPARKRREQRPQQSFLLGWLRRHVRRHRRRRSQAL